MKFITTWSLKPGAFSEAVQRFLAGEATPPKGVTLLGRWHSVDLSCGFSLSESNDPVAMYRTAAPWGDVLDLKVYPVIEDAEAGPVLASLGKK